MPPFLLIEGTRTSVAHFPLTPNVAPPPEKKSKKATFNFAGAPLGAAVAMGEEKHRSIAPIAKKTTKMPETDLILCMISPPFFYFQNDQS
jgi:hypothetical protein